MHGETMEKKNQFGHSKLNEPCCMSINSFSNGIV